MKARLLALWFFAFVLSAQASLAPLAQAYLFTYFTKDGEDGLHLAWSADGYRWEKLNNGESYLAPKVGQSKLMRDPGVALGPDGTFHLVWATGENENNLGYASTKDFITWSEQKQIPAMAHEPAALNAWAPQIVYDEKRKEFLIFWASTIPGKFPQSAGSPGEKYNHRLYCTTTKDFATFAPTRLFYDPGFSVIAATLLQTEQGSVLIVKDETRNPARKYLQLARAADLQGPFANLSAPFTPKDLWVEGATAVKVGADYVVYYDVPSTKREGAVRSRDLKNWEDVSAKISFPDEGAPARMQAGTVVAVTPEIIRALLNPRR